MSHKPSQKGENHTKSQAQNTKPITKIKKENAKYTLAQKIVGKACGMDGILPNNYCEPFNFGPDFCSNKTVGDVVDNVLRYWPGDWETMEKTATREMVPKGQGPRALALRPWTWPIALGPIMGPYKGLWALGPMGP